MRDLLAILLFQAGHNATVVILGVTLLGAAAGLVGSLSLLRKRSLLGDAVAHSTLPGIAGAFLIASAVRSAGHDISARSLPVLLAGASVTAILGVLVALGITSWSRGRIGRDAAIGVVLSTFFGAGFVLLSVIQAGSSGDHAGLKTFILGQAAAMSPSDAMLLGIGAVIALLACVGLYKEFRLVCFDEGFARVQGWPVGLLDALMMGLVVLVSVIGLQAVGLVLVVALLIIPAAAARFWSDRLGVVVALSGVLGALSGYLGGALSAVAAGMPTGAVVVLASAGVFLVSALAAPKHGVVSRLVRGRRLRSQVGIDHALRALYELQEVSPGTPIDPATARAAMASIGPTASVGRLSRLGLVRTDQGRVELTDRGVKLAVEAARRHRLWEHYLVDRGASDPAHADHPADLVEHAPDPELIAMLEAELGQPGEGATPQSVHPLGLGRGQPRSEAHRGLRSRP